MDKKGQGMPLNTIIIAIIVLIVLVVLIAIFTGRIAIFQKGVSEQSKIELRQFQLAYGNCHPSAGEETRFMQELTRAEKLTDSTEAANAKQIANDKFQKKTEACSADVSCSSTGCTTARVA